MRRTVKWLVRVIAGIAACLLLVVVAVIVLLGTESGTRWVISSVDDRIPGSLTINRFTGTLWSGLQVPLAEYRDSGQTVRVTNARIGLAWSAVPAGQIMFTSLSADTVERRTLVVDERPPAPLEVTFSALPVALAVIDGKVGTLILESGEARTTIDRIDVDEAYLDGDVLRVASASATVNDIAVSVARLRGQLSGDIPVRSELAWTLADSEWAGSGTVSGSLAALAFNHQVSGPYAASATGNLNLLGRIAPQVDALVSWERWVFGDYVLEDGEARVRGTADAYSGEYDVTLLLPQLAEPARVSGTASGNTAGLDAFAAQFANVAGDATVDGSLAWAPAFGANAQVDATGVDPSVLVPELNGLVDANFHLALANGDVALTNIGLTGELNDNAINATGNLDVTAGRVNCADCLLNVGTNRVTIDGAFGSDSESLAFSVNAPSLATLWPQYSGRLQGQGELIGAVNNPRFTGELRGYDLSIEGWTASEVFIVSRASSLEAIDVSASVATLASSDTDLGSFSISGSGVPDSLNVEVNWQFRELDVVAAGTVARNESQVDVTFAKARITEQNTGQWSLQRPLALRLMGSDLFIAPHVWSSELGELEVERVESSDGEIVIVAQLAEMPLQFSNSFLPENIRFSGSARADIDVSRSDGAWIGTVNWTQSDTLLRVLVVDQDPIDVVIPVAELNVEFRDGGAIAAARVSIEPGVTAALDVQLASLSAESTMVAELRLNGEEWYWIPALVPSVDNFTGAVSATVTATGPFLAPEFSGSLDWHEGNLAIPALNVPLSAIDLTVAGSSAGAATVSGKALAGEGELNIDGRLEDVMRATRSVNLTLRGTDAELINWPEYRLWASPDLTVVGTSAGWIFSGKLAIPKAEIAVRELPNEAVTTSEDVVVIGREEPVREPTRISGSANLVLGNAVHVQAFGLDTRLSGELQVRMYNDRPISADGEVSLVDGVFSAYGQKLTIQEGTLTFTGPLENPLVDVRAVRIIESLDGPVTAGIHLQGRAQSINSTVYSDPVMAEADALSYLVVGRPLSQATESEGGELASAALALGVRQAGRITDQIGQALGLDQLTVAGDGGDTTALVAGKQLNSRLHARYAYGVFSRLGTLLIRYRLSQRLTLEAGAGEAQSIDLLYLVEKE